MPDNQPVALCLKSPSGIVHYVRGTYNDASEMGTFCGLLICAGDGWEVVDGVSLGDRICKVCRVSMRGRGTRGIYRPMTRRLRRY